jgi:hypothetical protein
LAKPRITSHQSKHRSTRMDTGLAGPSADDGGSSRLFRKPNTTTEFLFVNSTSDSRSHQLGNRKEIRSHVRKGIARRPKQKHKPGQNNDAVQSKWKLLAPRNIGRCVSEVSSYDNECPSGLLQRSRLGLSEGNTLVLLTNLPYRELTSQQGFVVMHRT